MLTQDYQGLPASPDAVNNLFRNGFSNLEIKIEIINCWLLCRSHLPVKSVDTTLDFVVDESWVEDIFSEMSVMVAVGDEHVIVKLLLSARTGKEAEYQEEEEDEDDGDGGDQGAVVVAAAHQLCSLRSDPKAGKHTESSFLLVREVLV